jgi:two-component system sensor histidine kinase SenX3
VNFWVLLAAIGGFAAGTLVVLALFMRTLRRADLHLNEDRENMVDGATEVLDVLASAGLVIGSTDTVIRATDGALAMGLVNNRVLVHKKLRELVATARESAVPVSLETTITSGLRGNTTWVHVRAAKMSSDNVLLLVDDRTEAHRLDETRRDFIANISHELKTPIGAISLLSEALQDASDSPEMVKKFSGDLHRESKRLGSLVKEIIQLSRLQSAEVASNAKLVELHEVVNEAVELNKHSAEARKVKIGVDAPTGVFVFGDHSMLVTAVRNLIENAITYSDDNSQVGIGLAVSQNIAEIAVTDSGVGISAEDQKRIFERFYRVDPSRSRQTGGTGLGLSIVKHVAHNHRGEVAVFSKPGIGSTFTLRIPVAGAAAVGKSKSDKKAVKKVAKKSETAKSEKKSNKKAKK